MNEGDKCVCQESEWYNAFGDTTTVLSIGMRLTVTGTKMINGTRFYCFKETPKDNFFMDGGFTPLRHYN